MIVFLGLRFDPVKEILKIRSDIYILMKKLIIWGKYMRKGSLSLHHRKKQDMPQLLVYYIQYSNRKSRLVQMPEVATGSVLRKKSVI